MNASRHLKTLLAGAAAVALIGTAMAQGNPPNPAVKSAPVGAGQQSTQNTPMGTTGTPAGGSTATGATSNSSSSNMGTASTGNTPSGTSMGSSSTSADTSMTPVTKTHRARHMKRAARADRN
ncbi:proteophosphoglycan ppg4 [Caenimonas terrae]|uniref:Proteophosphoglycan ppg4 n=1 Tax=Caenimonas terrae TaxID=696074 RepID=A0ABW0NDZ0_9BURK